MIFIACGDFTYICFAVVRFDTACGSRNRVVLANAKDEECQTVIIGAWIVVIALAVLVTTEDIDDVLAGVIHTEVVGTLIAIIAIGAR